MPATPLLSPRTVAALRAIAERVMQDAVTISTPNTPVDDGAGSTTPAAPTTRSAAGRMRRRGGGREELTAEQLKERGPYALWLPASDPGVSATATVTALGRVYRVVYTPPVGAFDAYREVGLEDA